MPRTNDFLFIFSGGEPFTKQFNVDSDFNTKLYLDARDKLTYGRNVMFDSLGAGPDINANIDDIMKRISAFTNNQLNTIGRVCLLARSEGCALALGLAAELNSKGVTASELCFIGLSDVPMWDNGRPEVRHVGIFEAIPKPDENGATGRPSLGFKFGAQPVPSGVVPKVTLKTAIQAGTKINLFQTEGNHMKWSLSLKRWIWFSDLSKGEVHGKIDGFGDRKFVITTSAFLDKDLALHVSLNTGPHWKNMCNEAAQEFAKLPATPSP